MIPLSDIHVILPAYNEASKIQEVIRSIREQGIQHIIVVNDGSKDNTAERAQQLDVLVVNHLINRGAGAAVQTAIELARRKNWQWIALMDADGQHEAADLIRLKEKMEQSDCDIVIGSRFMQRNRQIPITRIFFNFIANCMTNLFCRENFSDSQSGLRLLNRRAIDAIDLQIDGFGFCSEMLIRAEQVKLQIEETPIRVYYTDYSIRKGQDFQVGLNTAFNFLWNALFK